MSLPSSAACKCALGLIRFAAALGTMLLSACSTMDVGWDASSTMPRLNFRVPAPLTEQLEKSTPCCKSLSEIAYQPISRQGSLDVKLDNDSPTFEFSSGKSRFAAFRLPDLPRPLSVTVDSFRTAEPGGLARLMPELRGLIFRPVVLILDAQFRITQMIDQASPGNGCIYNPFLPALTTEFEIDSAPAESSYMIVLTDDASRKATGGTVCGGRMNGFSPIGSLEIRLGSLGFGDGQIAYKAPFVWYRNARGSDDVGMFSDMFKNAATLLVTGDGLHFVEWTRKGYRELFSVPNERLVSVNTDAISRRDERELLVIGLNGIAAGEVEYHTFAATPPACATKVAGLLAPRIEPGRLNEKVGISVAETQPQVSIRQSRSRLSSDVARRIGDSAITGGILVAMPCGLCQAGGCPPEMLAPCGALFAVGAAVGGVIGIGSEIINGGPGEKYAPRLSEAAVEATLPAMRSASVARFAGMPYGQCLAQQFNGSASGAEIRAEWTSQGRRGEVRNVAWDDKSANENSRYIALQAEGYRYVADVYIESVNLLAEGDAGEALMDMPVNLEVLGHVHFRDLNRQVSRDLPLKWQSDPRMWATWSADVSSVLASTLDQACGELAKQAIEKTEATWKDW